MGDGARRAFSQRHSFVVILWNTSFFNFLRSEREMLDHMLVAGKTGVGRPKKHVELVGRIIPVENLIVNRFSST